MAVSVKDVFGQADCFNLGAEWDLLFGNPEIADHAVMVDSASPFTDAIVAMHATEMDSLEVMVRARVSVGGTGARNFIDLYARAEYLPGSPDILAKAYMIRLEHNAVTDVDTVYIYPILTTGPGTALASAVVVLDSENSHNFMVKVRDDHRGTQIDVFVTSESTPVLTYVDTATTRPHGMLVGFGLTDGNATQAVTLTDFLAYVLRSSVVKITTPPMRLLTFADIVHHVRYRLDRAGNSQFAQEYAKDFVNFAQDEVYNELLPWKWAFRRYNMVTVAQQDTYELPPYVALLYDVVNQSVGYQLSGVAEQDLNRTEPMRNRTGGPYSFTVMGAGDFGGWVVRLSPTPSGQVCLEIPYYARPIPMDEDTDLPLIPPNWLEILIFGALRRGSQYDTDRAFYEQNERSWAHMMNRMKRANYTDMKHSPRMRAENLLIREKATSIIGPTTRSQQLGL
jgi:hypothetical protein